MSLQAAVERLAKDLYESEGHFIQELVQNADDNRYAPGTTPSLHLALRTGADHNQDYFVATNNEQGMTERDVRALCDISRSSKSASQGLTTGYKGVGWKSVFRVSDQPHVLSGGWRFKFSSQGLGMLTPEWVDDREYEALPPEVKEAHAAGRTVFFLPLSDAASSIPSIRAELQAMAQDSAQLLFLRRLREVVLCGVPGDDSTSSLVKLSVLEEVNGLRTKTRAESFISNVTEAASEVVDTVFEVQCSRGVTVAVPLVLNPPPQRVFSCLPVRPVGFHFAVQAAFHLTASRADLHRCPENFVLRNAIAPAFLAVCKMNALVAASALRFLGSEPLEAFWLPVHSAILGGLRELPCVAVDGDGPPAQPHCCVFRGHMPAAKWVSPSLLEDACEGLRFVASATEAACHSNQGGSSQLAAMRELGIKDFGFDELVACLKHQRGTWLQEILRHGKKAQQLSDVYASLADALHEDAERLEEVLKLQIFPLAVEPGKTGSSSSLGVVLRDEVPLACAGAGLHTSVCSALPRSWQLLLMQCISQDLDLSSRGARLLEMLKLQPVGEAALEQRALDVVLCGSGKIQNDEEGDDREGYDEYGLRKAPTDQQYIAALAVLRRAFLAGKPGPVPWHELRGTVALPTNSGRAPAETLRIGTFLGIDVVLPALVMENIKAMAGLRVLRCRGQQRLELASDHMVIPPPPSSDEREGAARWSWYLGWEVFAWALGCVPAQPLDRLYRHVDGIELTLRLGQLLGSGEFWTGVASSPATLDYLEVVLAPPSAGIEGAMHMRWLQRVPVGPSCGSTKSEVLAIQDLFLSDVFQPLAGTHLPYLSGIPKEPRIHAMLEGLGVAIKLNQATLLKCVRWLRAHNVQDLGLAAEVYRLLEAAGFSSSGDEWIVFVPGRGFLHPGDCTWYPCRASPLLQQCCRSEALCEHYSRFGEEVRRILRKWVRQSPEEDPAELCDALHQAILCANADPGNPHAPLGKAPVQPIEATEGLLEASKACIEALVAHCVPQFASDAFADAQAERNGNVVFNFFVANAMIVVPDKTCLRVLSMGEAFWEVDKDIRIRGYEHLALKEVYGSSNGALTAATDYFFTSVLRVRRLLRFEDLSRSLPSFSQGQFQAVQVGLPQLVPVTPPQNQTVEPVDPQTMMHSALMHARQTQLPEAGDYEEETHEVETPLRLPRRRDWNNLGPLPTLHPTVWQPCVFGANDTQWTLPVMIDLDLIAQIIALFGLHPANWAFAYDPSGQCVCEQRLFLDIQHIHRAAAQPSTSSTAVFWASQIAHAIAHQGVGPAAGEDLHSVQTELLAQVMPSVLHAVAELEAMRSHQASPRMRTANSLGPASGPASSWERRSHGW